MDAPSLSPARSRELADLRKRAYGPDADIQRDPVAQARLHELEALARSTAEAAPAAEADARPTTPVPDAEATASVAAREEEATDDPAEAAPAAAQVADPAAPARRRWWQRVPLWSVTALVGIAAGVAIGVAWPTDSEPPPDLVLDVEPAGAERGAGFTENLNYWGVDPGSVVPHEAFDTIQVWTARAVDDARCVLLSHEGGFLGATCSGAGLDPVLDFTVYDGMSVELDSELPVGTVIRFVGRDGRVAVWVSVPGGQRGDAAPMT
ncbi:hypothetical protein [Microbacterium sp. HJ5]